MHRMIGAMHYIALNIPCGKWLENSREWALPQISLAATGAFSGAVRIFQYSKFWKGSGDFRDVMDCVVASHTSQGHVSISIGGCVLVEYWNIGKFKVLLLL